MIKRFGNDKIIIDDMELKRITKDAYDKGVIFGSKTTSSLMSKQIENMTSENFEEIKEKLVEFSDNIEKI